MVPRLFQDYKQLEGKVVEADEIEPVENVHPVIESALQDYTQRCRDGFKTG
jgi:inorganic pyrophosphatase